MISAGSNIQSAADTLKRVKIDYLYHSIRNPKQEILSMIGKLRIVRGIDSKQYSNLKRKLPYVVCALFNPSFRRIENFAYTEYFIVDIDHIYEKGLDIKALRQKIEADERVLMAFLSPSEDGLKVMFRLNERCYDAGIYSLFYKVFVREFSKKYGLEQVIDNRTSDVSRACFISIDPNVYFNPFAENIDINVYIPKADTSTMLEMKAMMKDEEKNMLLPQDGKHDKEPDKDTLDNIKALLNPKACKKLKSEPYVPDRLNSIMQDLKVYVEETGVEMYEVTNIQYGKKMKFRTAHKHAEINLFYGKHGFSVVQTPRGGTSAELNKLMALLISEFVNSIAE